MVPFVPAPFTPSTEPWPLLIYVASCGPNSFNGDRPGSGGRRQWCCCLGGRGSSGITFGRAAGYSARRLGLARKLLPDMPDPLTHGENGQARHRIDGRRQKLEVSQSGPLGEEQA